MPLSSLLNAAWSWRRRPIWRTRTIRPAWTADGTSYEQRGLKHQPEGSVRTIPIPPVLVTLLRQHLRYYAPDGRLFRGAPLSESSYGRAWRAARACVSHRGSSVGESRILASQRALVGQHALPVFPGEPLNRQLSGPRGFGRTSTWSGYV